MSPRLGGTQSTGDRMQLWGDTVSRGQEQGRGKGVEPRAEAQGSFRKASSGGHTDEAKYRTKMGHGSPRPREKLTSSNGCRRLGCPRPWGARHRVLQPWFQMLSPPLGHREPLKPRTVLNPDNSA